MSLIEFDHAPFSRASMNHQVYVIDLRWCAKESNKFAKDG